MTKCYRIKSFPDIAGAPSETRLIYEVPQEHQTIRDISYRISRILYKPILTQDVSATIRIDAFFLLYYSTRPRIFKRKS
jgi:hypothetical protein